MSPRIGIGLGAAASVCGLLLAPLVARAADDAGTRSPFARGPGSRGPAMGGAYTALADDATALLWNPGGLAAVSRLTLEAGHARFDNAETGEHFLALALPDWRWGTAALSVRHIGMGEIDARDERNQPLPGSSGAAETEIALGYGRSLRAGLGVGLAFRLERQVVGDLSASGLGADLGARVSPAEWIESLPWWAAPLSIGFALKNAVEPVVRLDRDGVPDPRVARIGLGWQRGPVAWSAEIEHGGGGGPRLHAGAEVTVRRAVALRAGIESGRLTVGTAIRFRGTGLECGLEDQDVGSTQRLGLTQRIGATVAAKQEAARLAEEQKQAERLEAAYEERRRQQVEALAQKSDDERAAGKAEDALQTIGAWRALAPDDARARTAEALVLRGMAETLERSGDWTGAALAYARAGEAAPSDTAAIAGRLRVQSEIDRLARRKMGRTSELETAYRAFVSGDLLEAREAFRRLSRSAPEDSESRAMLRRVEAVLANRLALRLEQARRDLEAGAFDDVERALVEARSLGAAEEEIDRLKDALGRKRQSAAEARRVGGGEEIAAIPAPVSEAKQREARSLYGRGLEASAHNQSETAVRFWELALELDPGHRGAREALKREYLLEGMEALGRGRYLEAERHWARVLELDPADERAREYWRHARYQLERTRELSRGTR